MKLTILRSLPLFIFGVFLHLNLASNILASDSTIAALQLLDKQLNFFGINMAVANSEKSVRKAMKKAGAKLDNAKSTKKRLVYDLSSVDNIFSGSIVSAKLYNGKLAAIEILYEKTELITKKSLQCGGASENYWHKIRQQGSPIQLDLPTTR